MIIKYFLFVIFSILLNKYFKQKNILPSSTGDKHQKLVSIDPVPLMIAVTVAKAFAEPEINRVKEKIHIVKKTGCKKMTNFYASW